MIRPLRTLLGWVLPVAAVGGIALALSQVILAQRPPEPSVPLAEPAAAPFESYVGGTGQVEPPGRTIAIAAPSGGIAAEVLVEPGQAVRAGAALIRLDDALLRTQQAQREAGVLVARAQQAEAEASLAQARAQLRIAEAVPDRRAISTEELTKRRSEVALQAAKLATAQAQVASAEAQLQAAGTEVERATLRAPVDAVVLQVNTRPGEFVPANRLDTPVLMLGGAGPPHLRVQVDENDAWRVQPGLPGVAFLRGNRDVSIPLRFVRTEPYVVPKRSLTGASTERVDTRVLEVVFAFEAAEARVYAGQLLDVFIEALPLPQPRAAR
jgi:RND family efflux transporter MFP subunit